MGHPLKKGVDGGWLENEGWGWWEDGTKGLLPITSEENPEKAEDGDGPEGGNIEPFPPKLPNIMLPGGLLWTMEEVPEGPKFW